MNILVFAECGLEGELYAFFNVIGGSMDHDLGSLELYGDDVDGLGRIFDIFFIFFLLFFFIFRNILLEFGFLFLFFFICVPV